MPRGPRLAKPLLEPTPATPRSKFRLATPLLGPLRRDLEQEGLRNSSLIAPSDGAHTPVISLDGHRPAATAEPAVIGIVVIIVSIVSVAALPGTPSGDVEPDRKSVV